MYLLAARVTCLAPDAPWIPAFCRAVFRANFVEDRDISAPDLETLAYGVAYAHAQDNVCQTAQQLVTIRGDRSLHFGPAASGLLGLRGCSCAGQKGQRQRECSSG